MIREFIQYLFERGAASTASRELDVDGKTFTTGAYKQLTADPRSFQFPLPPKLTVGTLSGLVDTIKSGFENLNKTSLLLHIINYDEVQLISTTSDDYGRRNVFATAKLATGNSFKFGQYMDHADFMIGLQTHFVVTPDSTHWTKLASNLTNEKVVTSDDDGLSQRVGVRQGVWAQGAVDVRPIVELAPFRTFRDIPQPVSAFLVRLKNVENGIPQIALFEADGGLWQRYAMDSIKEFLQREDNDTGIAVIC